MPNTAKPLEPWWPVMLALPSIDDAAETMAQRFVADRGQGRRDDTNGDDCRQVVTETDAAARRNKRGPLRSCIAHLRLLPLVRIFMP